MDKTWCLILVLILGWFFMVDNISRIAIQWNVFWASEWSSAVPKSGCVLCKWLVTGHPRWNTVPNAGITLQWEIWRRWCLEPRESREISERPFQSARLQQCRDRPGTVSASIIGWPGRYWPKTWQRGQNLQTGRTWDLVKCRNSNRTESALLLGAGRNCWSAGFQVSLFQGLEQTQIFKWVS